MTQSDDARFWDRSARKYAAAPIKDEAGYQRSLTRCGDLLKPDDRVLELGCGTGSTALQLAGRVQHYLATDISAQMIEIAGEKLAAQPVPTLSFRQAVARDLIAEGLRFDAVLAFSYLHLDRDPDGTLRGIYQMLPQGGLFISKTPCVGDMNFLIRRVMLPLMGAVGKAPYVTCFTTASLSAAISDAGFLIEACECHATGKDDKRAFVIARKP